MSITITTDVFCDTCGQWTHGIAIDRPERRYARRIAKDRGWKRKKVHGRMRDVCPACNESDTPDTEGDSDDTVLAPVPR